MELKPQIAYDDFAQVDIRVGTVLAAEMVPETDKLIKCTIDFGDIEKGGLGTRTIVSGIALFRTPESLVGMQLPYVVNLAPKMLRGVESQGMLLAIGDGEAFALLHPDVPLSPGARVK